MEDLVELKKVDFENLKVGDIIDMIFSLIIYGKGHLIKPFMNLLLDAKYKKMIHKYSYQKEITKNHDSDDDEYTNIIKTIKFSH